MAEATAMAMGFSIPKAHMSIAIPHSSRLDLSCSTPNTLKMFGGSKLNTCRSQGSDIRSRSNDTWKLNALPHGFSLPDWPLMAVMVEHVAGQRDYVVHKSVWHLSDETLKNIYTMYIMFTCWGCCFFGSTKDPFYDSELYRKDGGDGTVHWIYERQEEREEEARAELLREELIEEIEKKVGGLRELEEAKEEELV